MAEYKIEGKVKLINDIMSFPSGFTKREFVVTTQEQYPQDVKLEMIKDKCSILDSYQTGDEVEVMFDIRGNEYQGRYFVNLQAWRIQKKQAVAAGTNVPPVAQDLPPLSNDIPAGSDEMDDLPF
jgi:hypothetical protein